jgi:hypothetical protein
VTARSKAWIWDHSLAGTTGSNSAGGMGVRTLVIFVFCQLEVSATSRDSFGRVLPSVVCLNMISKL